MGKTLFAQSQTPAGTAFFVDCSGAIEPDLRGFSRVAHRCIIFDEVDCELVLRCKRLFQGSPEPCALGGSATNCHMYKVCTYRTPMYLCSNRWAQSLAQLSDADTAWLQGNQVYVHVTAPLWVS
jgi:hypothetical protein